MASEALGDMFLGEASASPQLTQTRSKVVCERSGNEFFGLFGQGGGVV